MSQLQIRTIYRDDVVVLQLEGDATYDYAAQIRKAVEEQLTMGHKNIVVDMSGTTWVDSAGLANVTTAYMKVNKAGGRFMVVAPSRGRLRSVLDDVKIGAVLGIFDSLEDALASIKHDKISAG